MSFNLLVNSILYNIYFNIQTLKKPLKTIRNNSSYHPKLYPFFSESGVRNYPNYMQELHSGDFDMQSRINYHMQVVFDTLYANYEYSPEYMRQFTKIVNYCHKNDINLYVYIPPMYYEHFYAIKEGD